MESGLNLEWKNVLHDEFSKDYYRLLSDRVNDLYKNNQIYPPADKVFEAFSLCPFSTLKIVVLGQDPYHGQNQAHGLAFSVAETLRIPPSLKNIYKEIHSDLGLPIPDRGNLDQWSKQGVLLLNSILTVEADQPGSHRHLGWEKFTDSVISAISKNKENVVFMLWGKFAESKKSLIDSSKHLILAAPHPSPFSAHTGFFGCRHFGKANQYLNKHGLKEIDWRV